MIESLVQVRAGNLVSDETNGKHGSCAPAGREL
jgi:hypothetical protein